MEQGERWLSLALFFSFYRIDFRGRCDSYESHLPLIWTIYFPTAPLTTWTNCIRNAPLEVLAFITPAPLTYTHPVSRAPPTGNWRMLYRLKLAVVSMLKSYSAMKSGGFRESFVCSYSYTIQVRLTGRNRNLWPYKCRSKYGYHNKSGTCIRRNSGKPTDINRIIPILTVLQPNFLLLRIKKVE